MWLVRAFGVRCRSLAHDMIDRTLPGDRGNGRYDKFVSTSSGYTVRMGYACRNDMCIAHDGS